MIIFLSALIFIYINHKNSFVSDTNIKNTQVSNINYVKIAGKIIKVELATTPDSWQKGLSGREKLKEDEGMLFIFNHTGQYSFWMKDMNFPIDIIWLDNDFRVIYIKKNVQPESYPESFLPKQNARYVLEVLAQFSEKNNLKKGDRVEFLSS